MTSLRVTTILSYGLQTLSGSAEVNGNAQANGSPEENSSGERNVVPEEEWGSRRELPVRPN